MITPTNQDKEGLSRRVGTCDGVTVVDVGLRTGRERKPGREPLMTARSEVLSGENMAEALRCAADSMEVVGEAMCRYDGFSKDTAKAGRELISDAKAARVWAERIEKTK